VARIVYIGGEATAAGFRLAGLDVRTGDASDAPALLRQALAERPECVLIDGTLLDSVPPALLETALAGEPTLFAVVPDVSGGGAPPDLARHVRDALGIET
jgi:vacuolar-type H+-ATPase subunit F/Vma7